LELVGLGCLTGAWGGDPPASALNLADINRLTLVNTPSLLPSWTHLEGCVVEWTSRQGLSRRTPSSL